jgi:crotonobetaine/carnitine-CoA ligase
MPRLAEIDLANLQQVVRIGSDTPALPGIEILPESVLTPATGTLAEPQRRTEPWDTQSVIYTSGTTGPSKGVLSSYMHLYSMGRAFPVTGDDRTLVNIPLFHASGTGAV